MEPSLSPHASQVAGYPYIPHNPTLAELEACTRRMRSVRFRHSPENRYRPSPRDNHSSLRGASKTSGDQSQLGFPESNQSDNGSEEESSGPETPYSLQAGLWRDEARPAFVPPQSFQPVSQTPPTTPAFAPAPAPNVAEEVDASSDLHTTSDDSDSNSSVSSTDRAFAYARIEEVIYELNSCVLKFKMPDNLRFAAPKDGEVLPQLPYEDRNKPLIHHKHELDALLDRLDRVESHGDIEIRKTRKQAVEAVERSLRELNRQQSMAWYNNGYTYPRRQKQYEQRQR
ncbi:hypothetical protein FRC10_002495 [Ceratobasidium sp. 414]|nr:hypothetical protein FRC10_002495 [Ceratobasidium sp. 414]